MDLVETKKQLTGRKSKKDELVGERKTYMKQIKEQGIKTLKEARAQLKMFSKTIDSLDEKFAKGKKDFKTEFGHLLDD